MRRDLTTQAGAPAQAAAQQRPAVAAEAIRLLAGVMFTVLLLALVYQIPAAHTVDVGGYDAAYVQGFYDAERATAPAAQPYLDGSNGSARWTRDSSYLVFPQIGLPAELTLRLRKNLSDQASDLLVLLNGTYELGRVEPSTAWTTYTFTVNQGLLKPNDVVIELRTIPAPVGEQDERLVGVLLDQASLQTTTLPITPYPPQLAYGGLAGALLTLLLRRPNTNQPQHIGHTALRSNILHSSLLVTLIVLALAFLLLYRIQPLYPYPLRSLLPQINLVLAALLAIRYGPALVRRLPTLYDIGALAGIGIWTIAVFSVSQQHLVLSRPGVETDFSVFARRSDRLLGVFQPSGVYNGATDGVIRADGFYNIGYSLLLWLVRPLTVDNPFLAGRLIAGVSGVIILLATWWIARQLLGRGLSLVALICAALSPLIVEYSLYLGTDMPFAALCTLAIMLLVGAVVHRRPTDKPPHNARVWPLIGAGLASGAAFLIRHPGLLLLPFGWAVLLLAWRLWHWKGAAVGRNIAIFTLAMFVSMSPQVIINTRDTGNPLFSWQAKNIWLAAYADADWRRQGEERNDIGLSEVILRDPGRFLTNWATNVRGYVGAGGENTSEFGRADQLRLLAFPANWLAIIGLALWAFLAIRELLERNRNLGGHPSSLHHLVRVSLLAWIGLYVLGVTVGLWLLRFALPLVPIYAVAAAWSLSSLTTTLQRWHDKKQENMDNTRRLQSFIALSLALLALTWNGFGAGASYVLNNQPPAELQAVILVQRGVPPGERVLMELSERALFDTYSAVAHRVASPQAASAANYRLRPADSPVKSDETLVGTAGGYALYQRLP